MKKILLVLVCLFSLVHITNAQIQTLQKLGQLSFATTCAGVWHYVDGSGNEYALLGNGDGLVIVDVTDPANPTTLFTVPAAASLWREVKTYGQYAYAGTEGGGGITIVDLSNLPASYISKTYDGDGAIAGMLNNSHTVQVAGDYLYIFGSNLGTVMCSLADPWNPVYVGAYNANYVHDGYVLNDTLYSSEVYAGQFAVVDVTDKANPVVLQTQATPAAFNHNGWFSDDRNYFYTTDEKTNAPLGVFDVSDISNIQLVGTYFNDTMPDQEVHNVRVINDFLINPSYGSQLTIYDGARPLNLIEIARYQTGGYLCWDASPYLPSGNIIATDMDGEFYVFAPYYVRACYLEGNVTNSVTGLPINAAQVRILTTTVNKNSDVLGDYRTGYPTAGTFDVQFSAPGYVSKIINGVVLSNGVLTVLDAQLDPFIVTIEVVDNVSGVGVPFSKVRIQNTTTDFEVVTDANGMVTLNTLSDGNYEITAALWGYKSNCIFPVLTGPASFTIPITTGIYDDFTFDFGWTVSGNATSGVWVKDEPIGTVFGPNQANPDFDSNSDCSDESFITGNGGGTANTDDVDDGITILTSPTLDLTSFNDPYLNYERWFYQQFSSNPNINDTLFISISNGITTEVVERVTGPSPTNSSWVASDFRILDFISTTSTMNVVVSISDKPGSGNPLEAGFDKFEITEGPTGINNPAEAASFMVFPNPFSSRFEILINENSLNSPLELLITDVTGRVINSQSDIPSGKVSIDASSWSAGVYFVRISNGTTVYPVQKIIRK